MWLGLLLFGLFVWWVIRMSSNPKKIADRPFVKLVRADVQAIIRDTRAWRGPKDHGWVDEIPDWMDR